MPKKSRFVHLHADISDHKTLIIPSNSEELYEYVEKHFQGHDVSLKYEAGCCGFSASRYFMNVGYCYAFDILEKTMKEKTPTQNIVSLLT